jgi:hypothetical protein
MRNSAAETFVTFLNLDEADLRKASSNASWMAVMIAPFIRTDTVHPNMLLPVTTLPSVTSLIRLHRKLNRDLRAFLRGENLGEIEKAINLRIPRESIRFLDSHKQHQFPDIDARRLAEMELGETRYFIAALVPGKTTFRDRLYRFLRQLCMTHEIRKLSLCQWRDCQRFIFQTTRPSRFCSNRCRWNAFNHSDERKNHIETKTGRWKK